MRQRKVLAGSLLSLSAALGISGCFTGGVYQVPGNESLTGDLTAETSPRVARGQQPTLPNAPAPQPQAAPSTPPPLPTNTSGITQTSLSPSKTVRVSVRALVNGKPIFEEEVMQQVAPAMMRDLAGVARTATLRTSG